MSPFGPKIWGKELEKDGAAWMAAKCTLPILSLYHRGELRCVEDRDGGVDSRVTEPECGFRLAHGDTSGDPYDVMIERSSVNALALLSIATRGMNYPTYARLLKMKVFLRSNPHAMISRAFFLANT